MGMRLTDSDDNDLLKCGKLASKVPQIIKLDANHKIVGIKSGINSEQPGLHYDF
jgi:hypothetical protein